MLPTTLTAIDSVLRTDPSVSITDRKTFIAMLRNGSIAMRNGNLKPESKTPAPAAPRILRRAEAAARLGRSTRAIDLLCAQGALKKVKFPGRKRAGGILESSLLALLAG